MLFAIASTIALVVGRLRSSGRSGWWIVPLSGVWILVGATFAASGMGDYAFLGALGPIVFLLAVLPSRKRREADTATDSAP